MKRLLLASLVGLWLQPFSNAAASSVVISEFMANNTHTLFDEDGNSPDWIELHNVGVAAVNLLDWSLTDNAGNPTKWRLPATNLNVGAFLIVFADGKDRRIPGAPLHANFKLSSDGGYLALVEPGGATVATQFSPYPPQLPNISFGFGLVTSNTTLIATGATARVLVPTPGNGGNTLGEAWKGGSEPFSDSAWRSAITGVGFSAAVANTNLVAASALTVRFNFDAAPVANAIVDSKPFGTLHNGVNVRAAWQGAVADDSPAPVSRSGVMQFTAFNGTGGITNEMTLAANTDFNAAQGTITFWMRSLGVTASGDGDAVLFDRQAVSGSLISGALVTQGEDGRLRVSTYAAGLSANIASTPGSVSDNRWHHVAVTYDQSAAGAVTIYVDGVPGQPAASTRAWAWPITQEIELGASHDFNRRRFNGALDDFRLYNRKLSDAEVAQLYVGDGGVGAADLGTDISSDMLNVNASAFVRVPFVVGDTNAFSLLTLRMKYDDGFVAWINGQPVAAANSPDAQALAWNSASTAAHSSSLALAVPIGNVPGLLRNGVNILAVQGLNLSAADSTFLLLPELIATGVPQDSVNGLYFSTPTPGAANNGGTTNLGPLIVGAAHTPNVPLDYQDLLVTAQVAPTFGSIANVTMFYRIMFNPEVSVPMNDSGTNGDTVAGDGIWSAIIPNNTSTNGQMIRYYVTALDTAGRSSRWPLFNDPANSAQYLGTIVNPTNLTSKLPIVHIFAPTTVLSPGPTTSQTAADGQSGARGISLFFNGEFYDNIYMALRGNSTAGLNKKAHRVEFLKEHPFRAPDPPEGIADRPLGSPDRRLTKTSFEADYVDPTYMRQGLSFWLCNLSGIPAPFYYPVRLQLNGDFYMLANHNDVIGDDQVERLGYDPNGATYNAAGQVTPTKDSTGGFDKKTRRWDSDSDYVALANAIAGSVANGQRATNIFDLLDLPNVISYMVVARWTHENDDVWANMTLYHDNDGDDRWRIIPFDMNLSWGAAFLDSGAGGVEDRIQNTNDLHKSFPMYGSSVALALTSGSWNRMYDVIFSVPATREMFLRRMRTLLDTYVQPPETHPLALLIERKVLGWRDLIAAEAQRDRAKWGWPPKGGQSNFDPGIDLTNGVNAMLTEFVAKRRIHFYGKHSVTNTALAIGISKTQNAGVPLAQPADASISVSGVEYDPASHNQAEEFVCLTNANAFAVDISGWKLGDGVDFTFQAGTVLPARSALYVSPDVKAFRNRAVAPHGGMGLFVVGPYHGQLSARGEPLTIVSDGGRLVYTNSYPGQPSLAQQFLRITEIMYNPAPLPGNTNDAQAFEYIELKNISAAATIDLTGVHFSDGILFSFTGGAVTTLAPGQRVLVVRNPGAFVARYGAGLPVAGVYKGALENNGERLRLLDADNEEILDFSYNNAWYPITDGAGFSLVVVDENAEPDLWDRPANWRPSGLVNGGPGQADPAPPMIAGILVNEVLTHTDFPVVDAAELFNPTAAAVSLGGWFLTDDFDVPKKYRIGSTVTIAPGGYVVFDESQFNTPSNAPTSFAFSSKGDQVWLFSGDASSNLTGYVTGYAFGAAENGVSFGRYTNSQGRVDLVAQKTTSLGGPNAGPKVGPVVISEIMYHPPDLRGGRDNVADEYVELENISGAAVPLYDVAVPAHTWRLRGEVDFDLPRNLTLPPNGFLVAVSFDPNSPDNAALLAGFRGKYAVPAGVPVVGPYQGKLANSAGTVKLERPDAPVLTAVPYIEVDRVEYTDQTPWPTAADGTGATLQRLDAAAYGNDPINWRAASPNPGGAAGGGTPPSILVQPGPQTGLASQSASFSVVAGGTGPLRYQWRFNGANIDQATAQTLTLNNLLLEQTGDYSVMVYNAQGTVMSSSARLSVYLPAYFLQQPGPLSLRGSTNLIDYGFTTNNAIFSALADGVGSVRYQWRFNGTNINGATTATLVVPSVGVTDDGIYDVVVTDDLGSIISVPARLKVLVTPVVVQAPANQVVTTNGFFTASVAIRGNPPPYRYEWREISTVRVGVTNNETTNFITYGPLTTGPFTNKVTQWRLVIFNDAAPPQGILAAFNVLSALDTDGDGLPDLFEDQYGLDRLNSADRDEDPDGDGLSNYQEFIAGTDPSAKSSSLVLSQLVAGKVATVSFQAQSNKTYSVQYTENLAAPVWSRLASVLATPVARSVSIADPNFRTNRFYRVVSPQQP